MWGMGIEVNSIISNKEQEGLTLLALGAN